MLSEICTFFVKRSRYLPNNEPKIPNPATVVRSLNNIKSCTINVNNIDVKTIRLDTVDRKSL